MRRKMVPVVFIRGGRIPRIIASAAITALTYIAALWLGWQGAIPEDL